MRWYADDSDVKTISTAAIPNAILFGGIAIAPECENAMREAIESAKAAFGNKRAPIKWNFKDLERKYKEQGQHALYLALLERQYDLRKAVFDATKDIDFSIIVSVVVGYSSKKEILSELKDDLSRYVFSNSLMRYALHVKETKPKRAEVILDWPERNHSKPFDVEYACAYSNGKTKDGGTYQSGCLEALNFHDSVLFTRMTHSTLLQFSDLLVGATREFVQVATGHREPGHGSLLLKTVANKFRGYPNAVIGRGININSSAAMAKRQITEKFGELYL